jgi:hypothetical protein
MHNRINVLQSGYWSDPNTWFGGILPSYNDEVFCNGNIVIIDQDIKVKLISNEQTYSDIFNGYFEILDNILINCDVFCGFEPIIKFNLNNLNIIGDVKGPLNSGYIPSIENNGNGLISVSGNIIGGSTGFSYGILNNSTGTINVSGSLYLGLGEGSYAIYNNNNGRIIINGVESTENGGYGDVPQF